MGRATHLVRVMVLKDLSERNTTDPSWLRVWNKAIAGLVRGWWTLAFVMGLSMGSMTWTKSPNPILTSREKSDLPAEE